MDSIFESCFGAFVCPLARNSARLLEKVVDRDSRLDQSCSDILEQVFWPVDVQMRNLLKRCWEGGQRTCYASRRVTATVVQASVLQLTEYQVRKSSVDL